MTAILVTEAEGAKLIADRAKHEHMPVIKPTGRAGLVPVEPAPSESAERSLADVEKSLFLALHRDRMTVIDIGRLLLEAKRKVEPGQWLPWLSQHFGKSESSAQNYMSAARWAAKYPTVGDLKLRPTALYYFGSLARHVENHTIDAAAAAEVEARILALAKTKWVDVEDCKVIGQDLQRAAATPVLSLDFERDPNAKPKPKPAKRFSDLTPEEARQAVARRAALEANNAALRFPQVAAAKAAAERTAADLKPISDTLTEATALATAQRAQARAEQQATWDGLDEDAKQARMKEHKAERAALSSEERARYGNLKGAVKTLVKLTPADVADAPVDDDTLLRAALLLIDIVALRAERAELKLAQRTPARVKRDAAEAARRPGWRLDGTAPLTGG